MNLGTMSKRYQLVRDDSGHDYVIPVEKATDWEEWVESGDWDTPEYAKRITCYPLTFTDPREGDGESLM